MLEDNLCKHCQATLTKQTTIQERSTRSIKISYFLSISSNTKNMVVLLNYFAKKKVATLEKVIGRREYNATLSIAEQKHLKFIHSPL
jgi:hypothetical protein